MGPRAGSVAEDALQTWRQMWLRAGGYLMARALPMKVPRGMDKERKGSTLKLPPSLPLFLI